MTNWNSCMWMDTPQRYGWISRTLHWTMAYLLVWQFITIATWKLFGDEAWVRTVTSLGPGHGMVGLLILALVIVRAFWAVINRQRRPGQAQSVMGCAAVAVHRLFYVLMVFIPGVALLRAYGSGKGYEPWVPATGVEVEWMMAPANLLHSLVAWCLSILIVGHICMALVHAFVVKDGVMSRMAGGASPARSKSRN